MDRSLGKSRRFGDGQGDLAVVHGGRKEMDTTEQLNWTELKDIHNAVWSPSLSISKKFSSTQIETVYPLNNNSLFLPSYPCTW